MSQAVVPWAVVPWAAVPRGRWPGWYYAWWRPRYGRRMDLERGVGAASVGRSRHRRVRPYGEHAGGEEVVTLVDGIAEGTASVHRRVIPRGARDTPVDEPDRDQGQRGEATAVNHEHRVVVTAGLVDAEFRLADGLHGSARCRCRRDGTQYQTALTARPVYRDPDARRPQPAVPPPCRPGSTLACAPVARSQSASRSRVGGGLPPRKASRHSKPGSAVCDPDVAPLAPSAPAASRTPEPSVAQLTESS